MRERQTPLTPELIKYLENNFTAEDDFLKNLVIVSWEKENIPKINITGFQANFLQFLIKSINAKNIIEIGTLAGYSAIVLARAAGENSKILTIEKDKKHFEFAKNKIKQSGLETRIEIINADAQEFLKSYKPEPPLDFIFIDANKSAYFKYFSMLAPYLRKGGFCVADNAFAFGHLLDSAVERNPNEIKSMLNYHKQILEREDFFSTLVPIGDGLLVSLKLV